MFGEDAYQGLNAKAATLLHSLVTHHALENGSRRLGLVAVLLLYGTNGYDLNATEDERVELIIAIAGGSLSDVAKIGTWHHRWSGSDEPFTGSSAATARSRSGLPDCGSCGRMLRDPRSFSAFE